MKTLNSLFYISMLCLTIFLISCDKDDDTKPVYPPDGEDPTLPGTNYTQPNAGFNIENGSAVVYESFQFSNTSSGDISSYSWDFGIGEGSSTSKNPT